MMVIFCTGAEWLWQGRYQGMTDLMISYHSSSPDRKGRRSSSDILR